MYRLCTPAEIVLVHVDTEPFIWLQPHGILGEQEAYVVMCICICEMYVTMCFISRIMPIVSIILQEESVLSLPV